jgi:hypothetical protein
MNMNKFGENGIDRGDSAKHTNGSGVSAPAEAELSQELMETQVQEIDCLLID